MKLLGVPTSFHHSKTKANCWHFYDLFFFTVLCFGHRPCPTDFYKIHAVFLLICSLWKKKVVCVLLLLTYGMHLEWLFAGLFQPSHPLLPKQIWNYYAKVCFQIRKLMDSSCGVGFYSFGDLLQVKFQVFQIWPSWKQINFLISYWGKKNK